jgi:HAD superfamily hydrolase (TIGR01509 family)
MNTVIFDMDGTLIDSEPLWKQAEMGIFAEVGVPLTADMSNETTGMRMDAAVEHWYERYPWKIVSKQEIAHRIKVRVRELVQRHGVPIKGAVELARALSAAGVELAVCSSSANFLIEAVCDQLGIRSLFKVLQSAEDCLHGKPHPEPYLLTARRLGVDPRDCVAIEDSIIGMTAAARAGMVVVGMPTAAQKSQAAGICAIVCADLTELSVEQILRLKGRPS